MNVLEIGIVSVGPVLLGYAAFSIVRNMALRQGRRWLQQGFPMEHRLFQWLQDRATSRFLGIDIGVVRARRRMDIAGKQLDG
jgi:hypothetical protein